MKHEVSNINDSSARLKANSSPTPGNALGTPWGKWEKSDDPHSPSAISAPPPVWTRYIDSRLKQFCTR
ncbi:MAG: hypothetical protein JWO87_1737 [Phycisphaerales bacterium]|jgi:hypothetical protein|nr:hypothetical protein [Phycisphaerales bacterium]MDB5300074.1 hypothetical protein [Phycisphaerales bacterium]MDB5304067.1 hypothetical protein [Phycisphaerales bacterium]